MAKSKAKILVVDDNSGIRAALKLLLPMYFSQVELIPSPKELISRMAEFRPDVVLLDMNFHTDINTGNEGLYWLSEIKKLRPDIEVVLFTAYADIQLAVEGMKRGAFDFVVKPWDNDKMIQILQAAYANRSKEAKQADKVPASAIPMLWGKGQAMSDIRKTVEKIAATDASVLITGENGTGKDVLAGEIHRRSLRGVKPMVCVDAGALTETLFESELFGHVKGAFTGADNAKKGYFHEAEGGTLFLDEVGNLALETQQMLLRAIQERRYRPVGDKADRNFNVRIIAATNEDLEVSVNEKRFRQDLLYRLHDFGITVPPLRDCQEDIMPLAEFFRDMANRELECSVSGFSSEARKALLTHAWPGNVRELRQKVMGAVLQAQEGVVMKEHLELAVTKPTSTVSFALRNDAEDKERILRALKQANGNRSVAAELLGIGRTTLYSKLEEYGLKYKFKQS